MIYAPAVGLMEMAWDDVVVHGKPATVTSTSVIVSFIHWNTVTFVLLQEAYWYKYNAYIFLTW